jgi:hypothetical protein
MKVLAIIDVAQDARMESVRAELAYEIRGSWHLFETGVLREAYATAVPTRVVFVLEADDAKGAQAQLSKLPMVSGGLVRVEVVELRPFVNWSLLFSR